MAQRPKSNLAIRLPADVIGIDVDAYEKAGTKKQGDVSLAEMEEKWGVLPPTVTSTSRPRPSGIRLYRVPEGYEAEGAPAPGIEIIQAKHRYLCTWPSTHPEGRPYGLVSPEGEVMAGPPVKDELPWLPAAWQRGLDVHQPRPTPAPAAMPRRRSSGGGAEGMVDGKLRKAVQGLNLGTCRHDEMVQRCLELVRCEHMGWPGASGALDDLRRAFVGAVTSDGSRSEREAEDEWARAYGGARRIVATEPSQMPAYDPDWQPPRDHPTAGANALALDLVREPVLAAVPDFEDEPVIDQSRAPAEAYLPAEFWEARPELRHIHQTAWATRMAPDALLHACFARVSAYTHHKLKLPAFVGKSPAPINYLLGVVGPPESGKSMAIGGSRDIVLCPDLVKQRTGAISPLAGEVADEEGPSSGQGLGAVLWGDVEDVDEEGNRVTKQGQNKFNVLFIADEGEILKGLASSDSSTLMPMLRTAATGGALATANATKDRYRKIPAGNYRLAMVVAFQPHKAGVLLSQPEIEGGTPQRFAWAMATDPTMPRERPAMPPPFVWTSPAIGMFREAGLECVDDNWIMKAAPRIWAEVDEYRYLVQTEQKTVEEIDGHLLLLRIKMAALLCLLGNRFEITDDDWDLAEMLVTASCGVRDWVRSRTQAAAATELQHMLQREQAKAVAKATALRDVSTESIERYAMKLATTLHQDRKRTWSRRDLMAKIAGKYRKQIQVPVLEVMLDRQWAVEAGDGLRAGPSRPS